MPYCSVYFDHSIKSDQTKQDTARIFQRSVWLTRPLMFHRSMQAYREIKC